MENKTAVERWEEYMKTDEVRPSHTFVQQFAKQFEPFTAHGLNQLPYVLMPAVAICCEEYASLQCAEMKEERDYWLDQAKTSGNEVKQLQEEVERLRIENQEYVGKVTFYRIEVEKLRQYAERNKIGKPNQKLFDALYDHIIDLRNEKDYWENHHRVLETESIAREVIEICKAHADDGHFDYDGALVNTMKIYEAKYDSGKKSKTDK